MKQRKSIGSTRRELFRLTSLAVGGMLPARRLAYASGEGIVQTLLDSAAKAKITVHPLRRNLSILEGSGGNVAVLTGRDGKTLVDTGFSVSQPVIANALQSINTDPIRHLINTHWHADHTDGNEWLNKAGAAITAHENTRKRLAVATRVEGWHWTFPARPAGALPVKVFSDKFDLQLNNTKIVLRYYGPAHTDSDISVHFTEADVVHVGDTWWNGVYPFIDYSTGGSIDGQIQAAEKNLSFVTDRMILIPGHGSAGNKGDMKEFRDMLVGVREKVAALKKQGRSLQDTIAAKPSAKYDEKWGHFVISPEFFTELVYIGV